jgi:hypothetical protein
MVGTLPDWFRLKRPPPALEAILDMSGSVGGRFPPGRKPDNVSVGRVEGLRMEVYRVEGERGTRIGQGLCRRASGDAEVDASSRGSVEAVRR